MTICISPEELREFERDLDARLGTTRWSRWSALPFALLGLLNMLGGPHSPTFSSGLGYVALALLSSAVNAWERPRVATANLETVLRFHADGIELGAEGERRVAWQRVTRAFELPGAIVILRRDALRREALFVPKRNLADGGKALWAYLTYRLVGKRLLVLPSASSTIVNTARAF